MLGRLVLGLDARRRADAGPIAIVPCDNIPDNGAFVARGVIGFAERVDSGLADWIRSHVSFVSTSVDRITPQAAEGEIVTEPFTDWVLAGEFPAGRPRWESAGARFVDDIEPWENRKLWLLNGAHCILAFAGIPKGLETVSDAIADPECRALVEDYWSEAVACLPPGTEHEDYREQLVARFANRRIVHRLSQIATGATSKVQFRFAAVAERTLDAGRAPAASAEATAAWIDWLATAPSESDPRADELAAAAASDDPVVALIAVVSPRLAASESFVARVRAATASTHRPSHPRRRRRSLITQESIMIIDKAEVIVTSPDRNFVTLKLTTDDGLTGLGDATLNGRELAVVAYLREHVVPLLIGRDASKIEDTWQFLYRSAYWRRGPVTMAAIARSTWRCGTSRARRRGCRSTSCSAARAATG